MDRHPSLRQRCQLVNRIVLCEFGLQFLLSHFERAASAVEPRIAFQIAHRIDARNAANARWILRGPTVKHQPATTPSQKNRLAAEPACLDQVVKQCVVPSATFRTPIRFPNIDSSDADARFEEAFQHPCLFFPRKVLQSRCVEHPWRAHGWFFSCDDERVLFVQAERLSRQWQTFRSSRD